MGVLTSILIEKVKGNFSVAVGGGAFPTAKLASWAIAPVGDATTIERALRGGAVPVIARVNEGRVLIDLRTIAPEDDDLLVRAIAAALA